MTFLEFLIGTQLRVIYIFLSRVLGTPNACNRALYYAEFRSAHSGRNCPTTVGRYIIAVHGRSFFRVPFVYYLSDSQPGGGSMRIYKLVQGSREYYIFNH